MLPFAEVGRVLFCFAGKIAPGSTSGGLSLALIHPICFEKRQNIGAAIAHSPMSQRGIGDFWGSPVLTGFMPVLVEKAAGHTKKLSGLLGGNVLEKVMAFVFDGHSGFSKGSEARHDDKVSTPMVFSCFAPT